MNELWQYTMGTGYRNTGFYVRGTGHFIITQAQAPKKADFGEIFWCIAGCGRFYDYEQEFLLHPGWLWYYPPNSYHHFEPYPRFDYRWLSIDGTDAGNLFRALRFSPGLNQAGACPEELFAEVMLNLRDGSEQSHLRALDAAFRILTQAKTPQVSPRPTAVQAKDFLIKNFSNPDIDISTLADLLHVHRITLNRLFQEAYGLSPGKYLNHVRLQEGIRLLTESSEPVKKIAELCGFASASYFTKALHRQTGHTPLSFRRRKS